MVIMNNLALALALAMALVLYSNYESFIINKKKQSILISLKPQKHQNNTHEVLCMLKKNCQ